MNDYGGKAIAKAYPHARTKWLMLEEVVNILKNHVTLQFKLTEVLEDKPESGSLYLVDIRNKQKQIKEQNHMWKNDNKPREPFKVGDEVLLGGIFQNSVDNNNFQRRIYYIIDQDFYHIHLVQFLEVGMEGEKNTTGSGRNPTTFSHIEENNDSSGGIISSVLPKGPSEASLREGSSPIGTDKNNSIITQRYSGLDVLGKVRERSRGKRTSKFHPYQDNQNANFGGLPLLSPRPPFLKVRSFRPNFGPSCGGTEVVISGDFSVEHNEELFCLFGNVKVPVIRSSKPESLIVYSPPNIKLQRLVTLTLLMEDGVPCSPEMEFRYTFEGTESPSQPLNSEERGQKIDSPASDKFPTLETILQLLLNHELPKRAKLMRGDTSLGGITLLQIASAMGYKSIVQQLTSPKEDIDKRDFNGCTALHWAVTSGKEEVVKALLEAGANPTAKAFKTKNEQGLTPEEIADNLGHKQIAAILHDEDLSGKTKSMVL